jgi:predicted site-specific integrase-resolvase
MMQDVYMTTTALAEYRCESVKSARRFMTSGRVAVYRADGRLRVLKSDVDKYMSACRVEPRQQPSDLKSLLESISAKVLAKKGGTK